MGKSSVEPAYLEPRGGDYTLGRESGRGSRGWGDDEGFGIVDRDGRDVGFAGPSG